MLTKTKKASIQSLKVLVQSSITLFGLAFVTFFIGRKVPIDPVLAIIGDAASPEVYEKVFQELGLHLPLYEQFFIYLKNLLQGDLGVSFLTSRPVLEDLLRVFPATLELATLSLIIGVGIGVPLGVTAAIRQGKWQDKMVLVLSLFGYSIPVFWLGLIFLLIFYLKLGIFPGPGRLSVAYQGFDEITGLILVDALIKGDFSTFSDAIHHLIMPAGILAYYNLAYIARMTRSFMLEEVNKPYVMTAYLKGLPERKIVWKHMFKNIRVPLLSVIGLSYGSMLEGSVLTEAIFTWPGLGSYLVNSLLNVDMNAVLGATLLTGIVFIGINTIIDTLSQFIDPRAKAREVVNE
jgi:peptide/nickel transport system permease protein